MTTVNYEYTLKKSPRGHALIGLSKRHADLSPQDKRQYLQLSRVVGTTATAPKKVEVKFEV